MKEVRGWNFTISIEKKRKEERKEKERNQLPLAHLKGRGKGW